MYNLLIADDESIECRALEHKIHDMFPQISLLPCVYDGLSLLKTVQNKHPDIAIVDINMPGTDGLEVCKRIRDHISCPILFLTARIEDTDKVNGFAVGGDDYIVKPFSLMELEARVCAHLRREARHNFEAQV